MPDAPSYSIATWATYVARFTPPPPSCHLGLAMYESEQPSQCITWAVILSKDPTFRGSHYVYFAKLYGSAWCSMFVYAPEPQPRFQGMYPGVLKGVIYVGHVYRPIDELHLTISMNNKALATDVEHKSGDVRLFSEKFVLLALQRLETMQLVKLPSEPMIALRNLSLKRFGDLNTPSTTPHAVPITNMSDGTMMSVAQETTLLPPRDAILPALL
ncbi:hypothetical protein BC834DRAFT_133811 [Gloeopeniophorella convolvens]|nr:hypothetical protein BC834DRAFT_133811 [Gloeopeniophorella convolvens]